VTSAQTRLIYDYKTRGCGQEISKQHKTIVANRAVKNIRILGKVVFEISKI
jgi:hypothetical protein